VRVLPQRSTRLGRVRTISIQILLAAFAAGALGCQESGFDERKETARPLKVQHILGESKVPGQAERPVALTTDALDDVLALGLEPVAAVVEGGELPSYLRRPASGVELIGVDEVEAADPDVILGSVEEQGERYEELSRIAPTVMIQGGGSQWKLDLRLVGEGTGRTNDAEALLSDYDRRVAALRRALPKDAKVSGNVGRDSFAATVLADAGVELLRSGQADARLEDPVWRGPGGLLAARAALADLKQILHK
jgi:ABC-type Fe3+-hydroxamate transport system substrate-binding protein